MNLFKQYEVDGFAATVEICESNGSGETITHNITDSDMGSVDEANTDPAANPIVAGERSFAKYQRLHMTALGGSTAIDNFKVWRTGALAGSTTHVTNAGEGGDYSSLSFAEPVNTAITNVDNTVPTSEPTNANLGIGTSLTGQLTSAGYSDYFVHQLVTDSGDVAGNTTTLNYQYDETA